MCWHVYYDMGSCMMGDHDNGLESFDTEEEAVARADELEPKRAAEEGVVVIIFGTEQLVRR